MNHLWIKIKVNQQILLLYKDKELLQQFSVSTALKGVGELKGSEQTPRGWHIIRAKIGDDCPTNTVFVGRRPTGEIYTHDLGQQFPHRDWILTRILWLSGLEVGRNRLGQVDTMRRYIYIHGTPDHVPVGQPGSHGCVRMHNPDLLALYNQVLVGTRVLIE
ncbi:MAG: L,D-transpeptidase [Coxiellaceae bacterium]|nr:MAG: L,D-transpeptidase [Coxiellaceae bacterium]